MDYIPLEKPIVDLECQMEKLKVEATNKEVNVDDKIAALEEKTKKLRDKLFSNLTTYEIVQLSRHPQRPTTLEYIGYMTSSFVELHGDRSYYDDKAIVGGIAKIDEHSVMIIGHQKGHGTKENIERNFGMPKPEGYRKAKRLMDMANRFKLPIITLIDTPGAYPGIGAEKRGQSEAIGNNLLQMADYEVPIVCAVIGEGGSGGALALGVGNSIHMMQYSIYSVISPEGCASILLKDAKKASMMAESLRLTAAFAYSNHVIDSIIQEPTGGAHKNPKQAAAHVKATVLADLERLSTYSGEEIKKHRLEKYLKIGCYEYTS